MLQGTLFYFLLTNKRAYHINKEIEDTMNNNTQQKSSNKTKNNDWYKKQVINPKIQPMLPTYIENEMNDKAIVTIRNLMREAMRFNPFDRPNASNILHKLKHYNDSFH